VDVFFHVIVEFNKNGWSHYLFPNLEHSQKLFWFHPQAQIKKLKVQLKIPKKNRNIRAYLLAIKKTVDSLTAIGALTYADEHIEVMLDVLSENYNPFVTAVMTRLDPYIVEDIEAFLRVQEDRLERQTKFGHHLLQANTIVGLWVPLPLSFVCSRFKNQYRRGPRLFSRALIGPSRFLRSSHSRFNSRDSRNSASSSASQYNKLVCQICTKPGHIAFQCWRRFYQHYAPSFQVNVSQFSSQKNDTCESTILEVP